MKTWPTWRRAIAMSLTIWVISLVISTLGMGMLSDSLLIVTYMVAATAIPAVLSTIYIFLIISRVETNRGKMRWLLLQTIPGIVLSAALPAVLAEYSLADVLSPVFVMPAIVYVLVVFFVSARYYPGKPSRTTTDRHNE